MRLKEQTAAIHRQTQEAFIAASVFFMSSGCSILTSLRTEPLHGFTTILATDVLASRLPTGGNCCQNTHTHTQKIFPHKTV
jgi:hypothetical protein